MQTEKYTSTRELGAVLKFELDGNYCRNSGTFTNGGAAPVQLQPGTLFTGGTTPVVFDTAVPLAVTGICITTELVAAGASVPVAWLENGPAIVNTNEIDFPANAGQTTTIKTALSAANFKLVSGL